jgi:signal transduction histidine kinase
VSIDVAIEDEHLRIVVRDRGPGLAPDEVDRVFDRFYRGGAGGSAFSSGMGLAITRGLLALQGGTVAAANAAEGGAIFTLLLPAAARPLADAAEFV